MRFEQARDAFLIQLTADGRSDHTIAQYRRHLALLDRWLESERTGVDVGSLDHEDIACFLASRSVTHLDAGVPRHARTVNAIRTSVRGFFRYLHAAGRITADPTRLTRRALAGAPCPRPLSAEEERSLVTALDGANSPQDRRDRALYRLLLGTGIRIGSAVKLEVPDVDLDAMEIRLRNAKGRQDLRLPLAPAMVELLADWIGDRTHGPLFPGAGAAAITTRHAQRRFELWLRRSGIARAASPHCLRHTFATRLYSRTRDIHLVQRALGHRSIESTLIYARADQSSLRAALAW